jgi:predicted nucleic acid-binding Zn ribbon protein
MAIEPLPSERNTVHTLGASLERLHRSMGLARPDAVRVLEDSWSGLVGARLARTCRLDSLRGGRMTIAVDDPAVAEHLRWQASDLAAAANQLCGGEVVEEVVIRVSRPGEDASGGR